MSIINGPLLTRRKRLIYLLYGTRLVLVKNKEGTVGSREKQSPLMWLVQKRLGKNQSEK